MRSACRGIDNAERVFVYIVFFAFIILHKRRIGRRIHGNRRSCRIDATGIVLSDQNQLEGARSIVSMGGVGAGREENIAKAPTICLTRRRIVPAETDCQRRTTARC